MRSGAIAAEIGRRLIEIESRGHGDVEAAMHRLAAKTGIDYWSFWAWRYRHPTEFVLETTWQKLVVAYQLETTRRARLFEKEAEVARELGASPPEETECGSSGGKSTNGRS